MANSRKKRQRLSSRSRAENRTEGFTPTAVNRPKGVESFNPKKAGNYSLDIIPYKVMKDGVNPYAKKAGMLASERTFFVHRGIGVDNNNFVCLAKTLKKACPICDARKAEQTDPNGDEKLAKSLAPKERQLWNVYDKNEPEKGVQIWDISFYLFGEALDDRVNNASEDREYEYYADPVDGMTLAVGLKEKTYQGHPYFEAATIDFDKRGPVDKEILAAATNLDDCLIIKTYDELKAIFLQIEEDEPDDDDDTDSSQEEQAEEKPKPEPKADKPKRTRKPKAEKTWPTADECGITKGCEVNYKNFVYMVSKVSGDGTSLTLVDDDGNIKRAVAPSEVKLVEEEAADETDGNDKPATDDTETPANEDNGGGDDEEWDGGDDWD